MKTFLMWIACLSIAIAVYFAYPCVREGFAIGGFPTVVYMLALMGSVGIPALMSKKEC